MASGTGTGDPRKTVENVVLEDHNKETSEVELQPIIVGPAAFGSPDPDTSAFSVNHPIEDGTHAAVQTGALSEDYGADSAVASPARAGIASADEVSSIDVESEETSKADLQKVAKFYDLSTGGSKPEIRDRILDHRETLEIQEERRVALNDMSRDDMNTEAARAGIENPESYANKDELRDAILAKENES